MRILFLSYAYPNAAQPQLGTFNRTMIAGLAAQHVVRVVAPVPFATAWRHRRRLGRQDPVVDGVTADHPTFYYVPKLFRKHYDQWLWWSVKQTVRNAIREFRPDVVLSYWAHPDGAVAVRAAHEARLPAVVMVGGSDVLILGRAGARRAAILDVFHRADAIVTVNDDIATTLIGDGIDPARLHVVSRGIDRSVFHPGNRQMARRELGLPNDRAVLLGVGRLVDVKDWPTWIAACRALVRSGRPLACYVCGGGPLETVLQRMIREEGLSDVVRLRGPQSQRDLARWYQAADLTVLSSRSEGVPNVLLETLACGGSFVATNVGGIPTIADPLYDRLVPPNDPAALAAAIADRLDRPPAAGTPRRFEPASQQDSANRLARVLMNAVAPKMTPLSNKMGRELVPT
jgi:teichuronic acid biosynthesis glycosyltransferase TuaC